MMGDYQVRFCEDVGVKFPCVTRLAVVNSYQNRLPIDKPNHGTSPNLLATGVTLIRHIRFCAVCRL